MLREESLVKIIGHPDSREPEFCDFKKITTLKNSIQTIRERWLGLSNMDKKYYEFLVCTEDDECIYIYTAGQFFVQDEFKDIIEL